MAERARRIKHLYSKDLTSPAEGKKLCLRSRCGWNDIIEMDTNALVINVRMSLLGWGQEQVKVFVITVIDLVFDKKLFFPEFIENCLSLLQTYCPVTLWLSSYVERTTSRNITFGLRSSDMNT